MMMPEYSGSTAGEGKIARVDKGGGAIKKKKEKEKKRGKRNPGASPDIP